MSQFIQNIQTEKDRSEENRAVIQQRVRLSDCPVGILQSKYSSTTMESTIKLIQDFLNQPYQWLIIELLSILGITDWLKYLIRKFLKETQRRFRDLFCDKALRRSFYRWMGKNYKLLPPWAKKLSRWVERILLRIRRSLGNKSKTNRDKQ